MLGIKQAELAEMVDVSRSTLSEIESGKHEPAITTALRLALALHCSVEDIFSLDDTANRKRGSNE